MCPGNKVEIRKLKLIHLFSFAMLETNYIPSW